jgi:hypothetical protein
VLSLQGLPGKTLVIVSRASGLASASDTADSTPIPNAIAKRNHAKRMFIVIPASNTALCAHLLFEVKEFEVVGSVPSFSYRDCPLDGFFPSLCSETFSSSLADGVPSPSSPHIFTNPPKGRRLMLYNVSPSLNTKELRWKSDTKFIDSHSGPFSDRKMPELMDKYKYKENTQKNKNRHD